MIAECKSAEIKLSQNVIDQAALYNTVLKAPYLLVTNGVETFGYLIDFELNQTRILL